MNFFDIFEPVPNVPRGRVRDDRINGALNLLLGSGETKVEVIDLLGFAPKTWRGKCEGRGWKWSQKTEEGSPHYFIEVM